jgi:cell division protease FtsH
MTPSPWLPAGHLLADGTRVGRLLHAGEHWQIAAAGQQRLLLAAPELAARWIGAGLLVPTQLLTIALASGRDAMLLLGGADLALVPLAASGRPFNITDALAFAATLRATRALLPGALPAAAIYCERCARLLPVDDDPQPPGLSDQEMLGLFLTGGVRLSAADVAGIRRLTGWMTADDVHAVLAAAGLDEDAPASGSILTRPRRRSDEGPAADTAAPGGRAAARAGTGPAATGPFRLPGRPALERFFTEHVIDVVTQPERYARLGIGFPGAVVLHGPPGSGKTFAVQRLVEHLGWPMLSIDSGSVGSPYIHETSRKLAELFDEAATRAPCVVVIDEMEAFVADRQAHQAGGLHHVEETAQLLQRIPEAAAARVLVIGMTNHLDMIDPAMLRRGRFDHVIEVGMPALAEVSALLDALLAERPVDAAVQRAPLAAALAGRALSDAAFVVREAARLTARAGREQIGQAELDAALAGLPSAPDAGGRRIGFIWD